MRSLCYLGCATTVRQATINTQRRLKFLTPDRTESSSAVDMQDSSVLIWKYVDGLKSLLAEDAAGESARSERNGRRIPRGLDMYRRVTGAGRRFQAVKRMRLRCLKQLCHNWYHNLTAL